MRYSFSKFLLIGFMCSGFMSITSDSDIQKKIIRNDLYDIEFYVALKKPNKQASTSMYYWYRSGEIHHSMSSSGGLLLHSSYMKFYRSNQLAEQGSFNYGLKDGTWKQWDINGQLTAIYNWSKGYKNGRFYTYDKNGHITVKGHYKKGLKSGPWINLKTKDTIFYKNGAEKIEDTIIKKTFFNRLFKKKADKKTEQQGLKNKKRTKRNSKNKNDEGGFLKRLFKTKDKKGKTKSS